MSRNYLADNNLFAVSANNKETALNTEQTLDTALYIAKGDLIQLEPRREDNRDEQTGKEEPDYIYNLGALAAGTVNFEKMQAQHAAFLLAYGLGSVSSAAWGTGYKHVITPTTELDLPSFTGAMRLGLDILKRRFASLHIARASLTFAKDSWAKGMGELKGTGKYSQNIVKESVTANYNATALTLAANAVQGATAAARLNAVHQVRVLVPTTGEWVDVTVSAVSDATPAVLTISAPGGTADSTTYEVLYVAAETGWMTFPSRVAEPPLRVTDLVVTIGGKWNGTTLLGGHTIANEIESIEYALDNQLEVEYRVGGTGTYANSARRQGRLQTLKLDRESRDVILQQRMEDIEYMGVRMIATGAEFETGKAYYCDLVFPRCAILKAPFKVNGKVVAEEGEIIVMQDDTYGSVIATVGNKVATYAA